MIFEESYTLHNGAAIPKLALGTWFIDDDKAAEAVEEASKDGPYLSLDDFRQRTKVSKTVIDLMAELGLFGNLPQSNQLSLFDFS